MSERYDVAIIGCGEAGIYAGYELMKQNPGLKVVVLEQGRDIYSRSCPIVAGKVKDCIQCKVCDTMCGFGGAALGAGGSGLAVGWITRCLSPKERAEVILAETDERNVAIREKAARDSWYWTGWLLWVPFVASLVTGESLFIALTAGVIVLHNAFLLVNMARWSRRM